MLKLKNGFFQDLLNFLQSCSLPAPLSRVRTRFAGKLSVIVKEIDDQRIEIIKKYAKKDAEGNPVVIFGDGGVGTYEVDDGQMGYINDEYGKILDQEREVPVEYFGTEDFRVIRDFIMNPGLNFGPGNISDEKQRANAVNLSNQYQVWADAFESVFAKKSNKVVK